MLLVLWAGLASAGRAEPVGNLQEAIQARKETVALRQEVAATVTDELRGEAAKALRKVVAKAESKQEEGNILMTKDRYSEAVTAYTESARFYRKALDWRRIQKLLTKAQQGAAIARLLAEATVPTAKLAGAKNLQLSAESRLEDGEIDTAIAEFDKARAAFLALVPQAGPATVEDALAARTAMQAARDQIKDPSPITARAVGDDDARQPIAGSLTDLLTRARKAEAAAGEALDDRQYVPARGLFAAAEKLYRDAAVAQGKRDAVLAARESVEDSFGLANRAFKAKVRPASFERGKQALAGADKAIRDDDLETAKSLLTQAAEQFAAARAEADKINALSDAQQAWTTALAAVDEALLYKHASSAFAAAKAKAADAQTRSNVALFAEATVALKAAVSEAKSLENATKAGPAIARLETALAGRDKFAAEDVLAELESLIPSDARMPVLRDKVAALPGPKKNIVVDLGGGVSLPFVLIRPGTFTMGAEQSKYDDERPTHKVAITKPFYLAKYEVTQEQWQAIMGSQPSQFKGARNPVEQVSWEDCQTFVRKLAEKARGQTFRLPTEAEWEYACRAGSTTGFCYGDAEAELGQYGWYAGNAGNQTHPVGEKKPNAWGLHDMHGNVSEWCADWHGKYNAAAATDPMGASVGSSRVLRGGAWNHVAVNCRSANRNYDAPANLSNACGLRVVVELR